MNEDFERGREAFAQAQYSRARRLFERAATSGIAGAFTDLGLIALNGLVDSPDAKLARSQFIEGANRGDAESHYWLAILALSAVAENVQAGQQTGLNNSDFRMHFIAAVQGRFSGALRAFVLLAARSPQFYSHAAAAWALAIALKDPLASYLKSLPHTDPQLSWLSEDVAAATPNAKLIEQVLLWQPEALQTVQLGPHVRLLRTALEPFACLYLKTLAQPRLQPAMVLDPNTGARLRTNLRTNSFAPIGPESADLAVRLIECRLAELAGSELTRAEPISILRYGVGEEYKPHRDYLHDAKELYSDRPGQRTRTVFAYLNAVEIGGETEFLHWNQRVSPELGALVMFDNVRADGQPEPDSVHAGLPVLAGEKWLASLWFRERPLRTW
jgi:prolyl 4-hydroxylase